MRRLRWHLFVVTIVLLCWYQVGPREAQPRGLWNEPSALSELTMSALVVAGAVLGLLLVPKVIAEAVVGSKVKPGWCSKTVGLAIMACLVGASALASVLLLEADELAATIFTATEVWFLAALAPLFVATDVVTYLDCLSSLESEAGNHSRGDASG
jgi:hypothetical protein